MVAGSVKVQEAGAASQASGIQEVTGTVPPSGELEAAGQATGDRPAGYGAPHNHPGA